MSYDLAVWFGAVRSEPAAGPAEPAREYARLVEAEPPAGNEPVHPRIAAFHREVTARYPDPDGLSDDDVDRSPWSSGPAVTSTAVLLSVVRSRVDEVRPVVLAAAARHGLVLFDPQDGSVHRPEPLRSPSAVLSVCDGSRVVDPDPDTIRSALLALSPDNWFAVLERGGTYVQVGLGERAATLPGRYALERRDGSADRHFRGEVADLDEVVAAFTGFARRDDTWPRRLTWRRLDLRGPSAP